MILMVRLREKASLLKGLIDGQTAYTSPFFVAVDVTRRCNLSCLHCRYHSCLSKFPSPVHSAISDMDPEILKKLLDELKTIGTREIIFAGEGEPLLYPNIFEAVSSAKAARLSVNLVTNGTLLNETIIRRLIEMRLDLLTVSVWASSKEEYEKLYPGTKPAYFKKALDAMKLVTDLKAREKSCLPALRLHRPVSRDNFRTVETALDQAREAGCNQLTIAPAHTLKEDALNYKLRSEEQKDLFSSLSRMEKGLRRHSIESNFGVARQLYRIGEEVWHTVPCYNGWVYARIRIDGTVFPCSRCDLPMGNIGEKSLSQIWNGEAYRSFRKTASTRNGLASMKDHCICGYCCHIRNNIKVHYIFRGISPFAPVLRNFWIHGK
jgi:MoaA/NifB/PqqE/SkfB family radical SAM enzyme